MTLFSVVIMLVDLRPQLHLFDDSIRPITAGFPSLLRVLVLELAIVHKTADRRLSLRGYLDQIEVCLLGEIKRLLRTDDANLFTAWPNQANFRNPDSLVNPKLVADISSIVQAPRLGAPYILRINPLA